MSKEESLESRNLIAFKGGQDESSFGSYNLMVWISHLYHLVPHANKQKQI